MCSFKHTYKLRRVFISGSQRGGRGSAGQRTVHFLVKGCPGSDRGSQTGRACIRPVELHDREATAGSKLRRFEAPTEIRRQPCQANFVRQHLLCY